MAIDVAKNVTGDSQTGAITDTSSALPEWLQEYTRGLASQASAVAGQEFTPYTAPANAETYGIDSGRIAGFNPTQQYAQDTVMANQNSYQPFTDYASQTVPQAVGSYMNPYTSSVVDRIAQLGQRNLTENLLPQVNSTFAGAGQFGSTRSADFTNRALRDANDSILGQQSSALQAGYTQAQNTSIADMQRYAALGQQIQNQGYQDVGMMDSVGQAQQQMVQQNMNLAQSDFTDQLNYPKQQLSFASDVIRGMPTSTTGFSSYTPTNVAATSPLMAAAQGFMGTRTLTSPTTTAVAKSTVGS